MKIKNPKTNTRKFKSDLKKESINRLYPAYIRDNELIEYFYGRLMNELYSLLSDTPSEFKYMAGFLMFNYGLIFLGQGLEPDIVRPNDNLIKTIRSIIRI